MADDNKENEDSRYQDLGSILITEADDTNVPVNCFLEQIEEDPDDETPTAHVGYYEWTASNFMPRRGRIDEGTFRVIAKERDVILELVKRCVVPLYQAALTNLTNNGENYYWGAEE